MRSSFCSMVLASAKESVAALSFLRSWSLARSAWGQANRPVFLLMRQNWGKKVSRSKEEGNDMEEKQEAKKVRRKFTPEQKFEILQDIERGEEPSRRD